MIQSRLQPMQTGAVARTASVYELKVTLRHIEPSIWRRLRVRSDVTLFKLHGILQKAMGWTNSHLHHFIANGMVYSPPSEFQQDDNEKRAVLGRVLRETGDSMIYEYDFGDSW